MPASAPSAGGWPSGRDSSRTSSSTTSRSPRPRITSRKSSGWPTITAGSTAPQTRDMSKLTGSKKATQFTESVIREMTRLNDLHGGVNLSQGFPDFPAPQIIKDTACQAIQDDINQYAVTWGARPLREAIARDFTRRYGLTVTPDEQVT